MRHWLSIPLTLCGLSACVSVPPETPSERPRYALTNVHVFPMTNDTLLRDHVVVIDGAKIESVTPISEFTAASGMLVIDGGGGYLLPGFADMHVHVRHDPQGTFALFLANGVTTVLNMDALDGGLDHIALRQEIREGQLLGPNYHVTGPVTNPQSLARREDVPAWLQMHADRGFDFVKMHMDLDPPTYDDLMRGADARGLRVVGHLQRQRPLSQSLGLALIAHAEELGYVVGVGMRDPETRREAAEQVAASGAWVTPTLNIFSSILDYVDEDRFAALPNDPDLAYLPANERRIWLSPSENEYLNPPRRAGFADRIRDHSSLLASFMDDLVAAGVPLLVGSDGFGRVVPGFSFHDELRSMVESGVTELDALRAATVNAAEFLGEKEEAGTIESGRRADLVLIASNPLNDIGATENLVGVIRAGRWIPREELQTMLTEVRVRYADPSGSGED